MCLVFLNSVFSTRAVQILRKLHLKRSGVKKANQFVKKIGVEEKFTDIKTRKRKFEIRLTSSPTTFF